MTQRANAYQKEKMVLCMYNFVILVFATQESGNKTVDYNILKDNLTRKPTTFFGRQSCIYTMLVTELVCKF